MKLLFVFPALLFIAGCRSSTNTQSSQAPQQKPLKIALITPNRTNDALAEHAFESSSGDKIEAQLASPSQQASTLQSLATQNFDLVFCASAECGAAIGNVAPKFPKTKFVVLGGKTGNPNVVTLAPRIDEAAYLCGIAAGDVSKTGVLGVIGDTSSSTKAAFDAFAAGARSVNPKIQVKRAAAGNSPDAIQIKKLAQAQIANGADVLFHLAGDAGTGALEAAQNATRRGKTVWAFGSGRNQNQLASDVMLGSATVDMDEAFDQIKKSVRESTFQSGVMRLQMSRETVGAEWNEANRTKISDAAWQKIDGALERLKKQKHAGD